MRKAAVAVLVGLTFAMIGGLKVWALPCGPLTHPSSTCNQYNFTCVSQGCQSVSSTCKNGNYNRVNESPNLYRGSCFLVDPPDENQECDDKCEVCTDNKYWKPVDAIGACTVPQLV